ncbi:MAG: hypothetical protein BM485_03160 [Desulfobulbaceae bacterium DB1]|nr:MAG: hypothetical protein BM485_03160 [Desulfobulbaceae bacterium DB1]
MKIFTSLAPHNLPRQQLAVHSWLRAGFIPYSLNIGEEIRLLEDSFRDVRFLEVHDEQTTIAYLGKAFVNIDAFFAHILRHGENEVCGIVNADIIIDPPFDLHDILIKEAAGGLVFGNRIDIHAPEERNGELFGLGFDYFFLDSNLAACYPASKFSMGKPFWDYWLPIVPLRKKLGQVKWLRTPIAFHQNHPTCWNREDYIFFCFEMAKSLQMADFAGATPGNRQAADAETLRRCSAAADKLLEEIRLSALSLSAAPAQSDFFTAKATP